MHHPDPNEKSREQRMVKKDAVMRRLLAATLSVSSLWQLMPPTAVAQVATPLTAAGTAIDNTATGTYIDPNTGTVINATSNPVTATVAEVAGVTVVSSGTIDVNGGSVTTGDFVNYSFLITNTGNDRTALHIPTSATTTAAGTLGTTTLPAVPNVLPATGSRSVYVTEINGVVLTSPVLLPASGNTNDPLFITAVNGLASGALLPPVGDIPLGAGSIPIGGTIKVVVPVTIAATTAGTLIPVTLGNTGTYVGDVGTNTQNQPDAGNPTAIPPTPVETGTDLGGADEVYTINVTTALRATAPANGVREASAKNTQTLATQINNLALATVLKKRIGYDTKGTASFADDTLTYRLDLNVETSAPAGSTGITPGALTGTAIRTKANSGVLVATTENKVLISDVIPANTILDVSALTPATVTINGVVWTRVYSTQPTTISALAPTQEWLLDVPTGTPVVTRIGYIANGPIASGYSTTGASDLLALRVQVITTGLTAVSSPVTIANIAQVFGQTAPTSGPVLAISPTNPLVYDESGDQNPNNYESGSPSVPSFTDPLFPAAGVPPLPTGIASPTGANGTDTNGVGNNNTGTGPGGEDNTFTINPLGSVLNGPPGQAGAVGPNGNNTDFVNKSLALPAGLASGLALSTATPAITLAQRTVVFTNTVQNPSTNTAQLDNVTLEPITAAQAAAAPTPALALADFVLPTTSNGEPLPNGTTVTIAYPVGSVAGVSGNTATYTLSATGFDLTQSTIGAVTSTTGVAVKPVRINSIAIGDPQDYNVIVVLPVSALATRAYSVPIVAYVDSNVSNSGVLGTGSGTVADPFRGGFKSFDSDAPFNIKIDRVYTGYLDLDKKSRVIQGTGPAVAAGDVAFSNSAKSPAPGNILEYLLTYKNISTLAIGTANVVLNANNIVITEDGATLPNNWATTTLNVPSTATVALDAAGVATPTYSAVITFFNGATAVTTVDPNVTRYLDSIPSLTPGQTGFFRFQRQVK